MRQPCSARPFFAASLALAAALALGFGGGCSKSHGPGAGGDGGVGDGGSACGSDLCGPGQTCCSDCDGDRFCVRGECPVFRCPPPPPPDGGTLCGDERCGPSESCCASCDGVTRFCSSGGCPGCPPPPPPDAGVSCGSTTCGAGERCCPGCCPDEGFCVAEGTPCPAFDCLPDACLEECGGFGGGSCADDEWCDYPEDAAACGDLDGTGVCRPRPEACDFFYDPVCGCDGVTHGNECAANAAGVDVRYEGECDCRTAGCPEGEYCGACESEGGDTAWLCMAEGTAC